MTRQPARVPSNRSNDRRQADGVKQTDHNAAAAAGAVQLPILNVTGSGLAANRTAAQSEIVALSDTTILVLARDSNGYGTQPASPNPVIKSVFMYDTAGATNLIGNAAVNVEGGQTSPAGVLNAGITAASVVEALNLLNANELAKFNFNLEHGNAKRADLLGKMGRHGARSRARSRQSKRLLPIHRE